MAPVNPYAAAPVPAKPAAAVADAPGAGGSAASAGFTPGLDAPRAAPRLADLVAAKPPDPPAEAALSAPQGVPLQQLSAYAGLVMEASAPAPPQAGPQDAAPARNARAERPLLPGSRLDLKV